MTWHFVVYTWKCLCGDCSPYSPCIAFVAKLFESCPKLHSGVSYLSVPHAYLTRFSLHIHVYCCFCFTQQSDVCKLSLLIVLYTYSPVSLEFSGTPLIQSLMGYKNLAIMGWPYQRGSLNKKMTDWALFWTRIKRWPSYQGGSQAGFHCIIENGLWLAINTRG